MEKENWINEILNSTEGRQQALPDAALFSRIELKIASQQWVSQKTVWLAAASIAVLVALNAIALDKCAPKVQTDEVTTLAASIDHSNQLYR